MVEGSKVDWAAHANDPIAIMTEFWLSIKPWVWLWNLPAGMVILLSSYCPIMATVVSLSVEVT